MSEESRSLEFEIEVAGTPEEVWRAIATGPGISSWYVPHTVEEREGGAATARFGLGPEMEVTGRIASWEPPERVVFDGGDADEGFAFEWLVEARDGQSCVVKLIHSGFGTGDDWDAQYDAYTDGWSLFLTNLKIHLEHFGGETATAALPGAMWPIPQAEAWRALTSRLDVPAAPQLDERIEVSSPGAPPLSGIVVDVADWRIAVLLDEPTRGTAIIAAEAGGEASVISIWSYCYGDVGAAATERDWPAWQAWLDKGPEG